VRSRAENGAFVIDQKELKEDFLHLLWFWDGDHLPTASFRQNCFRWKYGSRECGEDGERAACRRLAMEYGSMRFGGIRMNSSPLNYLAIACSRIPRIVAEPSRLIAAWSVAFDDLLKHWREDFH